MNVDQLLSLSPLLLLATAVITVMLCIAMKRNFLFISSMATAGIILTFLALAIAWQKAPVQATFLLRVDHYGLFFMALLLLAGLAVLALCHDYFKHREGQNEELLLLLLSALLGASVLVSSSHFATFFMGIEILSISLFVLISYPLRQARPLEAAIKYLLLSGVSSAFLLMGMALIYAQCGELYFSGIGDYIARQTALNAMLVSGIILIVAGLGFKLSLAPFHLWTPDVYQGAPAPISAFIATVSKGAVFVLLLRFFINTDSFSYPRLLHVFSIIAVLSILLGNLLALLQDDVKRILAYSAIAHIGYLLVALIAAGSIAPALAVESVSFYLVAYFITTIGAFGVVSVLSTVPTEADNLSIYRGLYWRQPWLAGIFTLMLLSLAGIPFTAGFIGKFYIFTSAAEGRLWGLLAAVIAGSGLGLYYYLRIIVIMSLNTPEQTVPIASPEPRESSNAWISTTTLVSLTMLLVWLGIYPEILINIIQSVSYTMQ